MIELIEGAGNRLLVGLEWVNGNASLISALATVAIAWLTFSLAGENRKLRKAGQTPQVVAYLIPHPDGNGAVNIVFANIGLGLAKEVVFNIICDEDDFNAHRVVMKTFKGSAPINVIPSGEKIVALFGIGFELFGNIANSPIKPLKPFTVRIEFADLNGRKISTISEIDIRQFDGLAGLMNKPALREIETTLKSMDKRFEVLARASKSFVNFVDSTSMGDQFRQVRKGDAHDGNPREVSE
jgi:hypothetical protein